MTLALLLRLMQLKPARHVLVSKSRRIGRTVFGPVRLMANISRFNFRNSTRRSVWITLSRTILILIVIICMLCTELDVLRQSFSSGQFWNAIIVIVCSSILIIWCCVLSLVRRVNVARWMRSIPRYRQISQLDMTPKMMTRIEEKRLECKDLFKKQLDFSTIEHPGLRNPLNMRDGNSGSDVPYWELADTIPGLLESNVTMAIPKLTIPVGCTVREYVLMAIQEKALEVREGDAVVIERFIELYERLRYSSRSMSWEMLTEMMDSLIKVGQMILNSRGYQPLPRPSFGIPQAPMQHTQYSHFSPNPREELKREREELHEEFQAELHDTLHGNTMHNTTRDDPHSHAHPSHPHLAHDFSSHHGNNDLDLNIDGLLDEEADQQSANSVLFYSDASRSSVSTNHDH